MPKLNTCCNGGNFAASCTQQAPINSNVIIARLFFNDAVPMIAVKVDFVRDSYLQTHSTGTQEAAEWRTQPGPSWEQPSPPSKASTCLKKGAGHGSATGPENNTSSQKAPKNRPENSSRRPLDTSSLSRHSIWPWWSTQCASSVLGPYCPSYPDLSKKYPPPL